MRDPRSASIPAVSVVMPVFNQIRFVGAAIDSVLEQSVPDVELVIADGGSTDGTLDVLKMRSADDPRVRWESSPDTGPAEAVNKAVARCRADLVGWLNSDDLYAEGAIAGAVTAFRSEPASVLIYGQGMFIDDAGHEVGFYPTLLPDGPPERFAAGCFICQPTAFFRRETFGAVGGLDPSLKASFDFDLWVRVFKAFPGHIGHVDRLQAYSRVHKNTITAKQRERVALEGIDIVSRHFGAAPAEWLLTHFEELLEQQRQRPESAGLIEHCGRLFERSGEKIEEAGRQRIAGFLRGDRRLLLAKENLFVGVAPDGWAGPDLEVTFVQGPRTAWEIQLQCRLSDGLGFPIEISWESNFMERGKTRLSSNQVSFLLRMRTRFIPPGETGRFRIRTPYHFVPAETEAGSTDRRHLSFQVDSANSLPPTGFFQRAVAALIRLRRPNREGRSKIERWGGCQPPSPEGGWSS